MLEEKKINEKNLDKISGGEGEQNDTTECTCEGVRVGEICPKCGKVMKRVWSKDVAVAPVKA